MRFIAQIELPSALCHGGQYLAYLFMSDQNDLPLPTWDPEGGENAVILQPGSFEPIVDVRAVREGPTLFSSPGSRFQNEQPPKLAPSSFSTRAVVRRVLGGLFGFSPCRPDEMEFRVSEIEEGVEPSANLTWIGGTPSWIQGDDTPAGGPWDFLFQIDSACPLFEVNFGDAGIGYGFIRSDGRQARFLWQCA